jgi:DNA-binding transcriptional MerR regulator
MDKRHLHKVREHFRNEAARERVRQSIDRGRSEATMTIGRAAKISGFSESQLRDWEKSGLLNPQRPRDGNDGPGGQRQYAFTELDKLAIIRELIDEANMSPGSIPSTVDEVWREIETTQNGPTRRITRQLEGEILPLLTQQEQATEYIDRRVETFYSEHLSWRYYASRALWLSLMLIHEDIPGFQIGLILPFHEHPYGDLPQETEQLPNLGPALVGWLGQTRSFYTFLTQTPGFEHPSDYDLLPLYPEEFCADYPHSPTRRTLIIVVRGHGRRAHRNFPVVNTVRRLLEPLYEEREQWTSHFGEAMRDQVSPNIDFTAKVHDVILTSLANMVVRLGGKKASSDENLWNACNILLPFYSHLPHQQQTLIVRAKSKYSIMEVGKSVLPPERNGTSLGQRAYQGGHITYRSMLTLEDKTPPGIESEEEIQSSIAIPIGAETGSPQGVLYVTSHEQAAFNIDDQRVLRVMARIIEELISNYHIRQQTSARLVDILHDPGSADPLFQEFAAETDFFQDVDDLLKMLRQQIINEQTLEKDENLTNEISFIGIDIDIDVQERIASSYGDQALRYLNKVLGVRIRDLLPALFSDYLNCTLYHIYSGRYYIFLRDFSLEKTKFGAERLRKALTGNIVIKQTDLSGSTLTLPDISIHLGVTHYAIDKLKDFLAARRERSVNEVSSTIYHSLNSVLKLGMDKGSTTIAWDPHTLTFIPYP